MFNAKRSQYLLVRSLAQFSSTVKLTFLSLLILLSSLLLLQAAATLRHHAHPLDVHMYLFHQCGVVWGHLPSSVCDPRLLPFMFGWKGGEWQVKPASKENRI